MTLRQWCDSRPAGEVKRLAKACEMPRQTMSAIVNGRAAAQLDNALVIWRHTDGKVSLASLLDPKGELDWPAEVRLFDADPVPTPGQRDGRAAELDRLRGFVQSLVDLVELGQVTPPVARRIIQDATAAGEDPWTFFGEHQDRYRTG